MADTLEYLLKLDGGQFTAPVRQATQTLTSFTNSVTNATARLNGLRTAGAGSGSSLSSAFDRVAHVGANVANIVAGVQAAHKAYSWLSASTQKATSAVGASGAAMHSGAKAGHSMSNGMRLAAGAIGAAGAAAGGAAIGFAALATAAAPIIAVAATVGVALAGVAVVSRTLSSSIRQAANFEGIRTSFEILIGDAGRAKHALEALAHFADTTPFEMDDVTSAAKKLLGINVPAEKLVGALGTLGNVAAAMGTDLVGVTTVFTQVINKQQLMSEEVQQFADRGLPVWQMLSDSMGLPVRELQKMAKDGKLTGADLARAFDKAGGAAGKFGNALSKQASTTLGLWSTLKDTLNKILRTIGAPINDAIRPMLAQAVGVAGKLASVLEGAVAHGKLADAIRTMITLGAKMGFNALINLALQIPAKIKGMATTLGLMLKNALSGNLAGVEKVLGSFDPQTIQFDTGPEISFLKSLMAGGAPSAQQAAGGLADAIPTMDTSAGDDPTAKKRRRGDRSPSVLTEAQNTFNEHSRKYGRTALDGVREKIQGFSRKARGLADWGGLDELRALNDRQGKNDNGKLFEDPRGKPRFGGLFQGTDRRFGRRGGGAAFRESAFEAASKLRLSQLTKPSGVEPPGQLTRRERRKEAEALAAKQDKPRWDLVQSIEKTLNNIAVA